VPGRGNGQHEFVSRAQWRWAHAKFGHGGWVKRWAETNKASRPFKTLPPRKGIRKKV